MKNAMQQACFALLVLTFTGSFALGQTPHTINVTGGGTLTYLFTVVPENCWVGGQVNYSDDEYGGFFTNAFSYKDTKGVVTNFSNTAQLTWVGSPGGASCPTPGWEGSTSITLPVGSDGTVTFQGAPNVESVSAVLTPPPPPTVFGYLNPKFLIMGVTYAPPGGNAQSFASYADTNFVGNTSNISSSFSQNYTESVAVTGSWGSGCNSVGTDGASLFGFSGGGCVTGTQSNAWTIASNSSKTVTTSKQTSLAIKTPGVPTIYSPVDHDYDIIWLWLNPVVTFTVPTTNTSTGGSITWTGYGYDYNDPLHEVDVWAT
jgi:hypothetical protein